MVAALAFGALIQPSQVSAQVTPAQSYIPPDDTPAIRVGVTIFADYTVQPRPKGTDADGNSFTPSVFNLQRGYLNITGQISHVVQFRVTPDIVRDTTTGSSTNGNLVYRLKYAYGQFNLDDWMARGSWARLGMQQTPWIDFMETVYRYRFQGTVFEDRESFLSSSDVGASFRYNFKNNYGDVHTGFYNGENYNRAEVNDQKAWMTRGSLRPLPAHPLLRGMRVTGFYNLDAYVKDGERRRGVAAVTYEHPKVNASFDCLWAQDQARAAAAKLDSDGFSFWVTPKTTKGWEGLLRFDHLKRDQTTAANRNTTDRTIAGVSYWFPRQGNVSAVLLFDYEQVDYKDFAPARSDEKRFAVHMLINF